MRTPNPPRSMTADKRIPKGAFTTLGQIARDQFKLPIPFKVIDFALKQDAKKNLY